VKIGADVINTYDMRCKVLVSAGEALICQLTVEGELIVDPFAGIALWGPTRDHEKGVLLGCLFAWAKENVPFGSFDLFGPADQRTGPPPPPSPGGDHQSSQGALIEARRPRQQGHKIMTRIFTPGSCAHGCTGACPSRAGHR
jgi:hypothetical protein